MMKNHIRIVLLISLLTAVALSSGCSRGQEAGAKPGAPSGAGQRRPALAFPVETQTVQARPVTYLVSAIGSVEAFEKVQVTARVSGVVERVLFSEGRSVSAQQSLVEIEPERYRLALEAAQAAYEKAAAARADAEAGLKRRESVSAQNPGLIPGEELETWRTKVQLAKSDVAASSAALNQAKLNLRDAYVHSPVPGLIQTRTVQTGQYVQPGTVLATLVRRDPMLLRFRVLEGEAAQLRQGQQALFKVRESQQQFKAKIVHIAASADEGTRMVAIVAEVNDPQKAQLRPGSFAQITVPIGSERSVPVIPQTAIRPSERGFLSFVVVDGKAVERVLELGLRTAEGQVEVRSGLQPGEQLVIRGAEALRTGATVKVSNNPTDKRPEQR